MTNMPRTLTFPSALILGLGAMIGAGIFAAPGPAAAEAGPHMLWALVLAALVAGLNASTMIQLSVLHPESGGTYAYARRWSGPMLGFTAGWAFVVGKLSSCAAMALTFAQYGLPTHAKLGAALAVVTLMVVNLLGLRKTVALTAGLLALTLAALALTVVTAWFGGSADITRLEPLRDGFNLKGVLSAAGFLFFAFAGYARLATMGGEVVAPERTIPLAVTWSLALTFGVYALVFISVLVSVDADRIGASSAPLTEVFAAAGWTDGAKFVRFGAATAALGVLLSLMSGIGRTAHAMAIHGDLPQSLSVVHPQRRIPYLAEMTTAMVIVILIWTGEIHQAIGASSFLILIYYAIAHVLAWRLRPGERKYPRALSALGFVSCLVIAFALPREAVVAGLAWLATGALARWFSGRPEQSAD